MKHLKQAVAILLTLLMLVTAVPFAVFAETHTHVFNTRRGNAEDLKSPANCSEKAVYYLACTCGVNAKGKDETKTYVDETSTLDATKHPQDKIVEIEAAVEATCQAAGKTAKKECSLCHVVVEESQTIPKVTYHVDANGDKPTCAGPITCKWCGETIPKDPNNHPADKIKPIQAAVEATCTQQGTSAGKRCEACGETIEPVQITTKPHTGGTATCVAKAKCTVCGQEYGEKDLNNHANLTHVEAKAPNCVEKGNIEYWKCEDCGKIFSDAQATTEVTTVELNEDPAVHKSLSKVSAKDAKCNETGYVEHWHCSACGKRYSDAAATHEVAETDVVLPTTSHTWGKLTLKEGSCAAGGTAEHECSVCHTKANVTLVAGQHPKEAWVTTTGKAATCTEAGTTDEVSCGLCGTVIQSSTSIPANGHDYENAEATPGSDSTHTLKCNICHQQSDPIPCTDESRDCKCDVCKQQLVHTFTRYESLGDATCAADGHKKAICDVCGAEDIQIDEGSHTSVPHQFQWSGVEGATCITDGTRKGICSVCNAELTEEVSGSRLGHTDPMMSDWQYSDGFDCEEGGVRFKRCTRCGAWIDNETIEPRPHAKVTEPAVKRTCTVDGRTAREYCEICGKTLVEPIIFPAEGHKADENGFTVVQKGSCTEDEILTATCGVCGEAFTKTNKAPGHKETDTVILPTCTEKGYTEHVCSVCGNKRVDTYTLPTDHKWGKKTTTPATTEANGKVVLSCTNPGCTKTKSYKVYRIKKITLSKTTFVRNSKVQKPKVTITDSKGNKLTKNVDYKLKYSSGCKKIGTYKVTITFRDEYQGKITRKFKIVPTKVKGLKVKAGKQSAKLTWSQNTGADVYAIYYSTAKDGKFKKLGTTTKLTYTATKLKTGTTYYFKVAAVRKLKSGNYYSANYTVKGVKVK